MQLSNLKLNIMKTIYLREKRSGNFEICEKSESTIKFKSQKEIKYFFKHLRKKVIKATYRLSQTYFIDAEEFIKFIK